MNSGVRVGRDLPEFPAGKLKGDGHQRLRPLQTFLRPPRDAAVIWAARPIHRTSSDVFQWTKRETLAPCSNARSRATPPGR